MEYRKTFFLILVLTLASCASLDQDIFANSKVPKAHLAKWKEVVHSRCSKITAVYSPLLDAPPDLLHGIDNTATEVWSLDGCGSEQKLRAIIYVESETESEIYIENVVNKP